MVDNRAKMSIMIGDETNKAVACGDFLFLALSPLLSQFNTFGGRTPGFTFHTRATPALRFLVSSTESDVESGAFSFYQKQTALREVASFPQSLTKANPEVAMADKILPIPLPDANSGNPESSPDSLSQQIKQTQKQVDALGAFISEAMSQMYQAIVQLERLQAEADPFKAFINNELDMEL